MTWGKRTGITPWKPRACADCGRRHPSFNRDGGKAGTPWRCGPCDAKAEPMPPTDPFAGTGKPFDPAQGSLL